VKSSDFQIANFQEAERIRCHAKDRFISAKLVFIGEALSKKEDVNGRPFNGVADRVLSTAMEKAGIKRSQVFITNLVKYRPSGNRVPDECEQTAYLGCILKGKFLLSRQKLSVCWKVPHVTHSLVENQLLPIEEKL
jgi:uracil-DNA glycosylase family 4